MLRFTEESSGREVMSLDGFWNFATDPGHRGENEKWYQPGAKLPAMPLPGYAPTANGVIRVPGMWNNQGYGVETDKQRHEFVGKGWYRREVEIPPGWTGRRLFLTVTGVSRYAKVWINGHLLGEHIGFLSAFEFEISDHVVSGQTVVIVMQVDSKPRWDVDPMYGASTTADYMDLDLGGIWGHVSLEARSNAWLSDLFVETNVKDSLCTVNADLNGDNALAEAVQLEVFDKNNQCCAYVTLKLDAGARPGRQVRVKASLPGAELWTDNNPVLYTARMTLLKNGAVLDGASGRFGMRQFTVDGHHLLLNGRRIMLRGYGDDHIYPDQMTLPCDKELHLARLRLIKAYGFNHVRHHSTMMPPEYYEACDEVGMITTAEFPMCAFIDIPGSGTRWNKRVPANTDPALAIETCKREWSAAIRRHRNHPCILCWVMGNELYNEYPLGHEFKRIVCELDSSRFFADSNGVWGLDPFKALGWKDAMVWPNVFDQGKDRDTLDLHFMQFNEVTGNPFLLPTKYECQKPAKPVILHEIGNYLTFSRPDLIDQFKHNIKPFWLTAGKAKLEKQGLLQEARLWAEKSERLYALSHKFNIESARRNHYVSGYHWWLFQDYWTTSNGIVDHYFRPKSITADEVLKINNEVVLLLDGLDRTYRAETCLDLSLVVSNYAAEPLIGDVVWEVRLGSRSLAADKLPDTQVGQGEVTKVARLGCLLPDVLSPEKITISASFSPGRECFRNDWSTWLYPVVIRPESISRTVFADAEQLSRHPDWDLKPIPEQGILVADALYLVGRLDARIVDALERGAGVTLLGGAELPLKQYKVTYQSSWWKAGDASSANHCGTFVYDHPVTRAMAPDRWCDDGWYFLVQGGIKFNFWNAPMVPDMIVRALPSMVRVEMCALLFEVCVGKGVLAVSGFNHAAADGRPENDWLITSLLKHLAGGPRPKSIWPSSFFGAK